MKVETLSYKSNFAIIASANLMIYTYQKYKYLFGIILIILKNQNNHNTLIHNIKYL